MNKVQLKVLDNAIKKYSETFKYSNLEYSKEYNIEFDNKIYSLKIEFDQFLKFLGFKSSQHYNEMRDVLLKNIHIDTCECEVCLKDQKISNQAFGFMALERLVEKAIGSGSNKPESNGIKVNNPIRGLLINKNKLLLASLNQVKDGGHFNTNISHYVFNIKPGKVLELSSIDFKGEKITCNYNMKDAEDLKKVFENNLYVLKPVDLYLKQKEKTYNK